MREITSHIVNPANDKLKITVLDKPGQGGACHAYEIEGFNEKSNPALGVPCSNGDPQAPLPSIVLLFQNGPIAEVGVNGVTHEALLAILIDRLEHFQAGPYACPENASALDFLEAAQWALKARTKARMDRGVEGTHEV